MSYCGQPRVTIFTGMTPAQLQAALSTLQNAYLQLASGALGETYTYTQGDGSKSVTYTRGNIALMAQAIAELQQMLGIRVRARRPIRPQF